MEKQRDITISLFAGIGFGMCRNTITITGEHKFITRNFVIGFILVTDTKCYNL